MTRPGRQSPRARRGFNLLELMLTASIIGVAAAIAAPRFSTAITRHRVESAAQRVAADLGLARSTARTVSMTRGLAFDATNDLYTLPQISDPDDATASKYTVVLSEPPLNTDLMAAWFGGDAMLTFDLYGVPDSEGLVVLRCGDEYRSVVLFTSGETEVRRLSKSEATPLVAFPPPDPKGVGVAEY